MPGVLSIPQVSPDVQRLLVPAATGLAVVAVGYGAKSLVYNTLWWYHARNLERQRREFRAKCKQMIEDTKKTLGTFEVTHISYFTRKYVSQL